MFKSAIFFIIIFLFHCSIFAQWSTDPMENNAIALTSGEEAIPKVATSENGTTYIAWFSNESGNYNVRLQQLDLFGNPIWEEGGLLISDHPAMTWLTDWDMTIDQDDHAILTFQDIRNGDNDVFAYRISPEGEFVWGEDGIELSTGPAFDAAPKVCITNSGDAVITWQADEVSIIQRISNTGEKLWGDDGISISSSGNTISWPQAMPSNSDDIILKYFEDSGPVWAPTRHVYAQRFNIEGDPVWENPTVISDAGGISAWTQVFSFISDGNDGVFIAWHDDRDNDMDASVFVQHVGAEGDILLGDDGTEASTQLGRENFYPFLALPDGSEEIFVFWNEMDFDQNNRGIYGQKISSLGERIWTDDGKAFIEISSTNVYPFSASSSGMDVIVFYENYSSVIEAGVSAMRIDNEGEFVWMEESIELCSVQSEKVHSVASTFVSDQWIASWEDNRNGNKDIYAQNIQLGGSLGPLSSVAYIEIVPDTLFIEENAMDYYIYVINPSYVNYTIENIHHNSEYWIIEDLPDFPYTLNPTDTLTLYLPVYYVGNGNPGMGYIYDTLFVEASSETTTSIVAFNLDVIPGIGTIQRQEINVYPNPGSQITFEVDNHGGLSGQLQILSSKGSLVWQKDLSGTFKTTWDGKSESGDKLPPGIYFYKFITEDQLQKGKIVLTR